MKNTKNITKKEVEEKIKNIFSKNPNPDNIRKAKNLAMSKNIKLKDYKKKFCKKCLTFFTPLNTEVRIRNYMKIIKCKNCSYINRYRLNALDRI